MEIDPGSLAETAENRPELFDAFVKVLKQRTDAQSEEKQKAELRAQLAKW